MVTNQLTRFGVFQGSITSPKLFNFYLNEALNSEPILKNKIENQSLYAFADDIAIKFKTQAEPLEIIQALKNLGPSYNLKLKRNKTKFLN